MGCYSVNAYMLLTIWTFIGYDRVSKKYRPIFNLHIFQNVIRNVNWQDTFRIELFGYQI